MPFSFQHGFLYAGSNLYVGWKKNYYYYYILFTCSCTCILASFTNAAVPTFDEIVITWITHMIFIAYPTKFSAISTRSGYFRLIRGSVRRPHPWRQDVVERAEPNISWSSMYMYLFPRKTDNITHCQALFNIPSLMMPNSYPRDGISIRTSQPLKILIFCKLFSNSSCPSYLRITNHIITEISPCLLGNLRKDNLKFFKNFLLFVEKINTIFLKIHVK